MQVSENYANYAYPTLLMDQTVTKNRDLNRDSMSQLTGKALQPNFTVRCRSGGAGQTRDGVPNLASIVPAFYCAAGQCRALPMPLPRFDHVDQFA